jgi:hypothetical protein
MSDLRPGVLGAQAETGESMNKKSNMVVVSLVTLIIVILSANPKPLFAAGSNFVGDGASCIALRGTGIINTCSYPVSLMWCADTNLQDTCATGLINSWDFNSGSSWALPIHPNSNGLSVVNVEGIACKKIASRGAFDLSSGDFSVKNKTARCVGNNQRYSLPRSPAYISAPIVQARP